MKCNLRYDSLNTLKLYSLLLDGKFKKCHEFYREFKRNPKFLDDYTIDVEKYESMLEALDYYIISAFDREFPDLYDVVTEYRPFFFAYRGDISLIQSYGFKNIAVIGSRNIDELTKKREENVVKYLAADRSATIVSGLASGADTVAHKTAINYNAKTVAFIPTTFENFYPPENKPLLDDIVKSGGLVVTEYVREPSEYGEKLSRFVDRDRLQAMFSYAVVLIAGVDPKLGRSGSAHTINYALRFKKYVLVMYDESIDKDNKMFSLNKNLIERGASYANIKTLKFITAPIPSNDD